MIRRDELEIWLQTVTSGKRTTESMQEWLNSLIIGDAGDIADQDGALIMDVFYRLNEASDEAEFNSVARDALAVLTSVQQNDDARALLPLVWGRDRLISILEKYQSGVVDDLHLRSFLKSDKWPSIAKTIQFLDNKGRSELLNSLRAGNYDAVARLLLGPREPNEP